MHAKGNPAVLVFVLALLVSAGCGVDQLILNNATEKGPDWVPDKPDPYFVRGQVFGMPGGTVDYYTPTGTLLAPYSADVKNNGEFKSEFPGTTEYRNLVMLASQGPARQFGLAVRLPRNPSIYHDVQIEAPVYDIGGMTWGDADKVMVNLNDATTTMTLSTLRSAYVKGTTLGSSSVESTNEELGKLFLAIHGKAGPVYELHGQVQRLLAVSHTSNELPPLFVYPDPAGIFLNPQFVAEARFDYTGDGMIDDGVEPFVIALDAASDTVALKACSTAGRTTVVFMADINDGNRDLNCNVINPFKSAINEEGKTIFITGGMMTDDADMTTEVCAGDSDKQPGCLTPAEWAEVNSIFGNWTPNLVAMRDDGQGGDTVAGDNIWTAVFEMPYIRKNGETKGVRVGYKYTYGFKGQGWTGTEEWPGNNRILEIEDVNTDALVVRYDYFGDETSNKNKTNLNTALCGSTLNPWPEEASPGCFSDTAENRIDTNKDCVPDAFPSAGAVIPNCVEGEIPGIRPLAGTDYEGHAPEKAPVLQALLPAKGKNGGGFLARLQGANFHPSTVAGIEVNSVDGEPVSVTSNALGGYYIPDHTRVLFIAPPFPSEKANVVVLAAAGGTGKLQLDYTDGGTVPCSLAYPAAMPDEGAGIPAGKTSMETHPVLGRLVTDDPRFAPELLVEVGLSPPCCNESEECLQGYGLCSGLPDPRYEKGWSFSPMEYDSACQAPKSSGLDACSDGESQFTGSLLPESGKARFLYAVRYSMDFGLSWDYCDLPTEDGGYGNENGYKWKDAGSLWVD